MEKSSLVPEALQNAYLLQTFRWIAWIDQLSYMTYKNPKIDLLPDFNFSKIHAGFR
jgi:hypothetical protein